MRARPLPDPMSPEERIEKSHELLVAAWRGDVKNVARLKDFYDPAVMEDDGSTPLLLATKGMRSGHLECAKLLATDAACRVVNFKGQTALMLAVQYSDLDMVKALLPTSDANAVDNDGRNALMLCFSGAHVPETAIYLAPYTDLKHQDNGGGAALHWALLRGDLDAVEAFIDRSDLSARIKDGSTPLVMAGRCLKGEGTECARLVLSRVGPEAVNETDHEGRNALHWAASTGNLDTLKLLLPISDASSMDCEGNTAEGVARLFGQHEAADLIASHTRSRNEKAELLESTPMGKSKPKSNSPLR